MPAYCITAWFGSSGAGFSGPRVLGASRRIDYRPNSPADETRRFMNNVESMTRVMWLMVLALVLEIVSPSGEF